MLNAKVKELLNQQVNKEFYSAYLYLDFSNYYETRGLDGFANWYKIQAQEERDHALLFYQYLHNNNETVTLDAIAKPDKVFNCDMDPLKAGLEHEMYVVRQRAGRRGDERQRPELQDGAVRLRSQGLVHAQQRAEWPGVLCTLSGTVKSI